MRILLASLNKTLIRFPSVTKTYLLLQAPCCWSLCCLCYTAVDYAVAGLLLLLASLESWCCFNLATYSVSLLLLVTLLTIFFLLAVLLILLLLTSQWLLLLLLLGDVVAFDGTPAAEHKQSMYNSPDWRGSPILNQKSYPRKLNKRRTIVPSPIII